MRVKENFSILLYLSILLGSEQGMSANDINSIEAVGNLQIKVTEGSEFKILSNPNAADVSYVEDPSGKAGKVFIEAKQQDRASVEIQLPKLASLQLRRGVQAHVSVQSSDEIHIQSANSKIFFSGNAKRLVLNSNHSEIDFSEADLPALKLSSSNDTLRLRANVIKGAVNSSTLTCVKVPESIKLANINSTLSGCH